MKNFILTIMLATVISAPAYAGYADRVCSEPQHKEVFRIGVARVDYKPQKTDCEVIHAGDKAAIKQCNFKRCLISNGGIGGH